MAYGVQARGIGSSSVGSGVQYSTTDIVITPTAGDEILPNNTFSAWTDDDPDDWGVLFELDSTIEVTERDSGQSHADTKTVGGSANFYNNSGASAIGIRKEIPDETYLFGISQAVISASNGANFRIDSDRQLVIVTSAGTFSHTYYRPTSDRYTYSSTSLPCDVTVDSLSCKPLYNLTQLWEHVSVVGAYSVVYSRSDHYQVGVVTEWEDERNYSLLFDNGKGSIILVDVVDGTPTTIGSYAAAYSAGKTLTLVRHTDGTRDIVYNNIVLAVGIAASGLSSRYAGAFLTDNSAVSIASYESTQGFLLDNSIKGVYAEDDWYVNP